jgi:hypothetical protein
LKSLFLALTVLFFSCTKEVASFSFVDKENHFHSLWTNDKNFSDGIIRFQNKSSKPQSFFYSLENEVDVPPNSSLLLTYDINLIPNDDTKISIALVDNDKENTAWQLPLDTEFLGVHGTTELSYSIPLTKAKIKKLVFSISGIIQDENNFIKIKSAEVIERAFGFESKQPFFASPFLYKENDNYIIDVPEEYLIQGWKQLTVSPLIPKSNINTRNFSFRVSPTVNGSIGYERITIPSAFIGRNGFPVSCNGNVTAFIVGGISSVEYPAAIIADPGLILDYPESVWRDENYEFFAWEAFPNIIIFDTKNYEVQDKMLKRLAFFVEKKGFRGRLAPDAEIENLHGWNAHDYRAEDLSQFYETARKENFPLNNYEINLREILESAKIIFLQDGSYAAGSGAIIAISRESNEYLRNLFMAHEGFHGIFFVDVELRELSRLHYNGLDVDSKRFIRSYFDYQNYDTEDSYLMINEYMAHILQQGPSFAGEYFGKTLPERLNKIEWRRSALPVYDSETESWPHLARNFESEAVSFSDFINKKHGLAGGRTWKIRLAR